MKFSDVPNVSMSYLYLEEYRQAQLKACLDFLDRPLKATANWKPPRERHQYLWAINLAMKGTWDKTSLWTDWEFYKYFQDNFPAKYRFLGLAHGEDIFKSSLYTYKGSSGVSNSHIDIVYDENYEAWQYISNWVGFAEREQSGKNVAGICLLRCDGAYEAAMMEEAFVQLDLPQTTKHIDFIIQFNLKGFKSSRTHGEDWAQCTVAEFVQRFKFHNNTFISYNPSQPPHVFTLVKTSQQAELKAQPDSYIFSITDWATDYEKKFGAEEKKWAEENKDRKPVVKAKPKVIKPVDRPSYLSKWDRQTMDFEM